MATLNEVKVKGDKFEPASQRGNTGDTVPFKNKRSDPVTVTLDANFFRPSSLSLSGDGATGNVTIIGTTGTGTFKAPKQQSAAAQAARATQTDNDIKGDIILSPNR